MKLVYAALASAILTACGGGGGTGDTGGVPTSPVGGGGNGGTSEIIAFTEGDYYTFKIEKINVANGVETANLDAYYTYTIQKIQPNLAHERIYTSWPYEKLTYTYNSNNFIVASVDSRNNRCDYADGLDNPTFNMQVGQKWDTRFSFKCSGDLKPSSEYHATGSITAKELIKTDAGDFWAFKTERTRERQITSSTSSYTETRKGNCWFDEKTSIVVACDQKMISTTSDGKSTETRTKITLVGINSKNHPVKKLTAATYYGNWQFKFTGEDPSQCSIAIIPEDTLSGQCTTRTESFSVSGKINQEGAFEANGTNGIKIQGTLNSPVESSGTWFSTTYNNISGTWTATHR